MNKLKIIAAILVSSVSYSSFAQDFDSVKKHFEQWRSSLYKQCNEESVFGIPQVYKREDSLKVLVDYGPFLNQNNNSPFLINDEFGAVLSFYGPRSSGYSYSENNFFVSLNSDSCVVSYRGPNNQILKYTARVAEHISIPFYWDMHTIEMKSPELHEALTPDENEIEKVGRKLGLSIEDSKKVFKQHDTYKPYLTNVEGSWHRDYKESNEFEVRFFDHTNQRDQAYLGLNNLKMVSLTLEYTSKNQLKFKSFNGLKDFNPQDAVNCQQEKKDLSASWYPICEDLAPNRAGFLAYILKNDRSMKVLEGFEDYDYFRSILPKVTPPKGHQLFKYIDDVAYMVVRRSEFGKNLNDNEAAVVVEILKTMMPYTESCPEGAGKYIRQLDSFKKSDVEGLKYQLRIGYRFGCKVD